MGPALAPRLLVWRPLNPTSTPPGGTAGHSNRWPSTHSHTYPVVCPQGSHAGVRPWEGGACGLGRAETGDRAGAVTPSFSLSESQTPKVLPGAFSLLPTPFPLLTLSTADATGHPPRHPRELPKHQPPRFCSPYAVDQGSGTLHCSLQASQLAATSRRWLF